MKLGVVIDFDEPQITSSRHVPAQQQRETDEAIDKIIRCIRMRTEHSRTGARDVQ